ncbi:MAG: aromatic aminobenezylarsenical efflux permease ArsG family transporter [Desulfobacteraceae bacterium]|jgi:cytochrome c-type biogenesis protein|nr:aromatic aminobenezylarsenical efflux permease ArsG family transporter [Desulfobacteraceae bacterium]
MEFGAAQILSVIWLGILTSISPCPLATNIAATTYIGKQIKFRYATVLAAVAYTIGRTIAYMLISILIIAGLISIPGVSNFLQHHMNQILGPVLLVSGLFILDLVPLKMPNIGYNTGMLQKLGDSGFFGAVVLGFLFALSFCPVSAALFFGSVIPVALKFQSAIFLPFCYGIGTAAPVIGFAVIIAYSSRFAGIFFNKLPVAERWLRRITGVLFVFIGLYFCFKYIFKVINF